MSEMEIKKGNLKISVFDEFDFAELTEIVKLIEARGYKAILVDNGNVVLQKVV